MIAVPPAPTFSQRGFTLTEMAVVLVIVALLIGGMLAPISTQQEARNTSDSQVLIKTALESLLGFAGMNGRLPCPADPTLDTGLEDCTRQQGSLPWAVLGIDRADAWGRKFTYRVSSTFTTSFTLQSVGDITVTDGAATPANLATQIPAIIVSHGANGRGAYVPGSTAPLAAGTGNELENSNVDATFVSKTPDPNYDDLVAWLPATVLINRMISAGKLP